MGGCTGKGRGRGGSSNTYPYTWRSCERQGPRAADAAAQAGSDGVVVVVMLQVTGACRVHDGPLGTRVRARRAPGANLVLESIGGGAKVRTRCGVHVVLLSPGGQVTSRRVSQDGRRTGRCYLWARPRLCPLRSSRLSSGLDTIKSKTSLTLRRHAHRGQSLRKRCDRVDGGRFLLGSLCTLFGVSRSRLGVTVRCCMFGAATCDLRVENVPRHASRVCLLMLSIAEKLTLIQL